jgi:hypothetical protein
MTGRVENIDLDVHPHHLTVFRGYRDPALAFQLHAVHEPFGNVLPRAKGARLREHRVDERRLAVINMRDYRDVPDFRVE